MKLVKTYSQFLNESQGDSQFFKTREETKNWLDKMGIKKYKINDDLSVDVNDCVDISKKDLEFIPVQFGKVKDYFYCYRNELTSLKGSPKAVGFGGFDCSNNRLTSLKYCPKEVFGTFYCGDNYLTSLEYSPTSVSGSFYCYKNELESLEGCPTTVGGDFSCRNNLLKSLEGCPQKVGGDFICSINDLTSLVFAPKEPEKFESNLCSKFYIKLGWTLQAHAEALKTLDPNPADTIQRLKKYNPILSKELSLELGFESEELTDAYNTSKNVEGDFY